jgi:uncharacterized phage protein gp47/JayE
MAFGVTSSGFIKKTYGDIKTEYESQFRTLFGLIDTTPASTFGQLIGVLSKREADVWDVMEQTYLNAYPKTAGGVSLDHAVGFNGLTRLPATKTKVYCVLRSAVTLTVPINTRIASTVGALDEFISTAAKTVQLSSCVESFVTITTPTGGGKIYTVTVNGVGYSYTSYSTSANTIMNGLVSIINAQTITRKIAAEVVDDELHIYSVGYLIEVPMSFNSDFTIQSFGSTVLFEATSTGPKPAIVGAITDIKTPVIGLISVNNYLEGSLGRIKETDTALRIRRDTSVRAVGSATAESIKARILQEVEGVSSVYIYENDTSATVDGRPPHSFEAVVIGGDQREIAQKIWEVKPSGISTYGTTSVLVSDSQGLMHTINFSRSTTAYIWIEAIVTLFSEEVFPANGRELIAQGIVDYFANTPPGKDLIVQKVHVPIYAVPGISFVFVIWNKTSTLVAPTSHVSDNLVLDVDELPEFSVDRITVSFP